MAAPISYSKFDRTYNNAIDLVAEAVGHSQASGKALKQIQLAPMFYLLFKKGAEVLARQEFSHETILTWQGVEIVKADRLSEYKKMRLIYHNPAFNQN